MIKIKRGLDVPITGTPVQRIDNAPEPRSVAVIGFDYHGMRPTMEVSEGERVRTGQLLFTDKRTEGVRYTAPATGTVRQINRGPRRVLQSVVIDVEAEEPIEFGRHEPSELASLDRSQVVAQLVESGLWTALRTRPYSKVPAIDSAPGALSVTAIDTHPLAADPVVVIAEQREAFLQGLELLSRLTEGRVHVCIAPGAEVPVPAGERFRVSEFSGPHPAGLVGTHIHFLEPASAQRWSGTSVTRTSLPWAGSLSPASCTPSGWWPWPAPRWSSPGWSAPASVPTWSSWWQGSSERARAASSRAPSWVAASPGARWLTWAAITIR